jgi:Ca2+-binding RTX toxin-like protein
MRGGYGDDRYTVDDSGDIVVEYNGAGNDTVTTTIDYVLPQKVENLVLAGDTAAGTGNTLDNHIVGNGSDNVIDGGLGDDRMEGGRGDDVYVVDSAGDVIIESSSGGKGGIDSVLAASSFVLPEHVENLSLTGEDDIKGTGNGRANRIDGSDASDRLSGLGGNDTLTGHGGRDIFAFSDGGRDVVTDLDLGEDKLDLRDTAIGSRAELIAASKAKGSSVVVDLADSGSVILLHTSLSDLDSVGLIFA